jgi:hypothetical protein
VRALEQLLDPALVLKRDLEATTAETTAKRRTAKKRTKALTLPTHVFIPDTQVKPGVPTVHLEWIGSYIADSFENRDDVKLIIAGDWWDMPSLSSYDVGTARLEGVRVAEDILAGNDAFSRFDSLIPKKKTWEYHFLFGNHEQRIERAVNMNAQLEGLLGYHLLDTKDWQRHDYQQIVDIDGVWYSHVFVNPMTGRPYGGQSMDALLKTVGHSFTQGHRQGFWYGLRYVGDHSMHACICGAAYLHTEDYKGYQGNAHYRGIIVKNEVQRGAYSIMDVSLDFLCRRFEGMRLVDFLEKYET